MKIKLADLVIGIKPQNEYLREYCKHYITEDGIPELEIALTEAEILREGLKRDTTNGETEAEILREGQTCEGENREGLNRERTNREGTSQERLSRERPDQEETKLKEGSKAEERSDRKEKMRKQLPYLETLAVLRKIADYIPQKDRFLMHGAVISWKGKGWMFTAPSGTGKSTHIALWKKYLGKQATIVNGDKPILAVTGKETRVYGTPWAGKENWENNISVPLHGICILQRGTVNTIQKIHPKEALPLLMRQVYYPSDPQMAGKVLELLDQMLRTVPLYLMQCDISREAVKCSFETMTGEVF